MSKPETSTQLLKIIQLEEASGPDSRIELDTQLLRLALVEVWEEGYTEGIQYLYGESSDNPYEEIV